MLVVGVVEIVDPGRGVGIDVHDIGVQEIVVARERTAHCLADDLPLLVEICRIFRYYRQLVGDGDVGVILAPRRVEAVLPLRGRRMVENLVYVIKLCRVELAAPRDGVGAVYTLYGPLLVLVGIAPGNRLVPVEIRLYGISLLVLLYLESLVSAVCRVGETLADDGISYPEHKLLVLRVCDLGLVHPEGIHRDPSRVCLYAPYGIPLYGTHRIASAVYEHHPVGSGLRERGAAYAGHLSSGRASAHRHAGGRQESGGHSPGHREEAARRAPLAT